MKKHIIIFFALTCCCLPAFSQEQVFYAPDTVFVINSIHFEIDGITSRYALLNNSGLKTGEEITGFERLEAYIDEKISMLLDTRLFDEVLIEKTIGSPDPQNRLPVDLFIYVNDTWNIIAVPFPKFDSNSGFNIAIKARDNNIFGTMTQLRIDLGYGYDTEADHHSFNFLVDFNIPFQFLKLDWNAKFLNELVYSPGDTEPLYLRSITGLSLDIPFFFTTFTLGMDESIHLYYGNHRTFFYMSSYPFLSWEIPTGLNIGDYGQIIYTPAISAVFNHEFPSLPNTLKPESKKPILYFTHNIGFGKIQWIGNFRTGLSFNISNSWDYLFFSNTFKTDYNISFTGHIPINDAFGISGRLMFRQWFNYGNGYDHAGDVLRGIINDFVTADLMLSMNLEIGAKLLKFRMDSIFKNTGIDWFDFDLHVVPFIDLAIYRNPQYEIDYYGSHFTFKNVLASGGVEILIFPKRFGSYLLRASLGFNYSSFNFNGSIYELFIGMEMHF